MRQLQIPTKEWSCRPHQKDFMKRFDIWSDERNAKGQKKHLGVKRGVFVWHRRAGKDEICQWAISKVVRNCPGAIIAYAFPTLADLRGAMWKKERLSKLYPPEILNPDRDITKSPPTITFKNGATVDGWSWNNPRIGAELDMIVVSEYQFADPEQMAYIEPMLDDSDIGVILITGTPRGENHFHDRYFGMVEEQERDPSYTYASLLTRTDTELISDEDLLRRFRFYKHDHGSRIARLLIDQEYFCSWKGGDAYAIYSEEMLDVVENRLAEFDIHPDYPINLSFDLGHRQGGSDHTVGIAWQLIPAKDDGYPWINIIDYAFSRNVGLEKFIEWAVAKGYGGKENSEKGGICLLPGDFQNRSTLIDSPKDWFWNKGFELFEVTSKPGDKALRTQMCRQMLASKRTYFHTRTNELAEFRDRDNITLIKALRNYKEKWHAEKMNTYPLPGQVEAHFADAIGGIPMGMERYFKQEPEKLEYTHKEHAKHPVKTDKGWKLPAFDPDKGNEIIEEEYETLDDL